MNFPLSMEDAKRALGQIPEAMKENLGNPEPQAEKEATGQIELSETSTNLPEPRDGQNFSKEGA